jgi:hypothetical protein
MSKLGPVFLDSRDFFDEQFPDLLMKLVKTIGSRCINSGKRNDLYMSLRLAIGLLENFPN